MMQLINKLLIEDLRSVPFHNFRLIINKEMPLELGGTCSDKTLFFQNKLKHHNIESILHFAKINGKEVHRLLKIVIDNQEYLLDVGLGWPIIYPIPINRNSHLIYNGLEFKTVIHNDILVLYRKKKNHFIENYQTKTNDQNQTKILDQINDRFNDKDQYPFNGKLRFSKIVNNEFYFLRDDNLKYTKDNMMRTHKITSLNEFELLFSNVFNFDLNIAMEVASRLNIFNK